MIFFFIFQYSFLVLFFGSVLFYFAGGHKKNNEIKLSQTKTIMQLLVPMKFIHALPLYVVYAEKIQQSDGKILLSEIQLNTARNKFKLLKKIYIQVQAVNNDICQLCHSLLSSAQFPPTIKLFSYFKSIQNKLELNLQLFSDKMLHSIFLFCTSFQFFFVKFLQNQIVMIHVIISTNTFLTN